MQASAEMAGQSAVEAYALLASVFADEERAIELGTNLAIEKSIERDPESPVGRGLLQVAELHESGNLAPGSG